MSANLVPVGILDLPEADQFNDSDFVVIQQAGKTKKLSKTNIGLNTEEESEIGPIEITASGSNFYAIKGHDLLIRLVFFPTSSGIMKVGTSIGASDIIELDLISNQVENIVIERVSNFSEVIHFTGSARIKMYINTTASVSELTTVNGSAEFDLPAESVLERIMIYSSSAESFSIGESADGSEIITFDPDPGVWEIIKPEYVKSSNQTIYFTGNATLKIFTI